MLIYITLLGVIYKAALGYSYYRAARYAVASCSNSKFGSVWDLIAENEPEYLVLTGDNLYNDIKLRGGTFIEATPFTLQVNYEAWREDLRWKQLVNIIGDWSKIIATWDDHDYGINDGDLYYQYKNESLESFLNFFRFSDAGCDYFNILSCLNCGGMIDISHRLERGGVYYSTKSNLLPPNSSKQVIVKYVVLDTRYFKDKREAVLSENDYGILGSGQWKWLQNELNDSTVDIIFLVSSIQVLPTQKIVEEGWSDYPRARKELLHMINHSPCPNVVILSGDVHMAEYSQVYLSIVDTLTLIQY